MKLDENTYLILALRYKELFNGTGGGGFDDVPFEKLASYIVSQLARRDIMVFDVEIFEFIKRKISFKETKGGVLIKNKKFNLDGSIETISCDEEEPEYLRPMPQSPQERATPASMPQSLQERAAPASMQAIRWEIFDPDPALVPMLLKKHRLTVKRKYPIFEEKTVVQNVRDTVYGSVNQVAAMEYTIIDGEGQKTKVASMHFMPELKGLIGMDNTKMTEQDYRSAPRLMHMDNNYQDMPVLRR